MAIMMAESRGVSSGSAGSSGASRPKMSKSEAKKAKQRAKKGQDGVKKHLAGAVAGVLSSKDAEARLTALWSILSHFASTRSTKEKPEESLVDWPIVHTAEGFCCTVDFARKVAMLHLPYFAHNEEELKTMRHFGCTFATATAAVDVDRLASHYMASCVPKVGR